mmetsp:Transcript_32805/g.89860  ORF Transcript_32805/g.89860 Transcript_32805/m.89860 type:complete len:229 (+) Transcript_32805:176-862(+)
MKPQLCVAGLGDEALCATVAERLKLEAHLALAHVPEPRADPADALRETPAARQLQVVGLLRKAGALGVKEAPSQAVCWRQVALALQPAHDLLRDHAMAVGARVARVCHRSVDVRGRARAVGALVAHVRHTEALEQPRPPSHRKRLDARIDERPAPLWVQDADAAWRVVVQQREHREVLCTAAGEKSFHLLDARRPRVLDDHKVEPRCPVEQLRRSASTTSVRPELLPA